MNREPSSTAWNRVFVLFLTGVAGAFLVGKAPAALPALRTDLDLSLLEAGLVVSMFSIVAAVGGVMFGVLADRFGHKRAALTGLTLAILGSLAGSWADGAVELIATRALEGAGFFALSVSIPPLMLRLVTAGSRQTAMGLWGAYLPAGASLVLLVGGVIMAAIGWRGLWQVIAIALALFSIALVWAAPPAVSGVAIERGGLFTALRQRGPRLLTATFGCYSAQFLAVTAFVPLILVERAGWSIAAAAAAGALIMGANVTGNLASGALLDRGVARATLIRVAATAMAIGATVLMLDELPVPLRIAGGVFFSSFGGLIPGALFAGVPRHAPSPQHISTVNGMMFQGVAIGQITGPVATSFLVGLFGDWTAALLFAIPVALVTFVAGTLLGRLEQS